MSTRTRPAPAPPRRNGRSDRAVDARRRRRRAMLIRAAVVGAVAVTALFLIARGGSGDGSGSGSGPVFQVGEPATGAAPTFTLPSTAGGSYDLAAARGKTVLLYFNEGLMCQPCWDQIRDIEENWAQFSSLGIDEMIAITTDPLDQLRQKVDDEDLGTPVLSDRDLSLADDYDANQYTMMGTSMYGHSFLVIGPDGEIQWRADYGGQPNYTMYVSPVDLLADLRAGVGGTPGGS